MQSVLRAHGFSYFLAATLALLAGCSSNHGRSGQPAGAVSISRIISGGVTSSTVDADAMVVNPAPSILGTEAQVVENQLFPAAPGIPAKKRLWRLTVAQLANTVRTLLGKSDALESQFDTEIKPLSGLGNDADVLLINSDYASKLETVLSPLLQSSTAALATYLPCGSAAAMTNACLDSFIKSFGGKAFRRPVSAAENQRYQALYQAVRQATSNDDAVAAVAEAMLRSPNTQFRTEVGADGATTQMTATEVATALAFGITNNAPDQTLLAAAASGELLKPEVLGGEVKRLMGSAAFVSGFTDFFLRFSGVQWLGSMSKDQGLFPEYTPQMMQAMVDETKAYVKDVMVAKKGDFKALMTSPTTTIQPALAAVYKVPAFTGSKAIIPAATERSGLFTLPGVIAANTKAKDTSLVKRGVFLLNTLVCVSPPPPPPDIPALPPLTDPNATMRQHFSTHVANPTCAGCHRIIDPFGFAMEHYDPIGRYRSLDNGAPVDAADKVVGTRFSDTSFTSVIDLLQNFSSSPEVHACMVKNAFRYTFGREETAGDAPILRAAYEHFVASNFDLNEIFAAFYASPLFQLRKAE